MLGYCLASMSLMTMSRKNWTPGRRHAESTATMPLDIFYGNDGLFIHHYDMKDAYVDQTYPTGRRSCNDARVAPL
jgi:hypothetical protein